MKDILEATADEIVNMSPSTVEDKSLFKAKILPLLLVLYEAGKFNDKILGK